jgi:phosphoribosyl-ATP pyrophosphohydrolase/phosphoribosyl-AMP cyclohydrolase/histidinol dehydrogenase
MAVFLPLITKEDPTLFGALDRIGPVVVNAQHSVPLPQPPRKSYLLFDPHIEVDVHGVAAWLDEGIDKVIVPISWAKDLIGVIPSERILILLDAANASAVSDKIRGGVSGVLLKTPAVDFDLISSISNFFKGSEIYILLSGLELYPSLSNIREFRRIGATFVIPDIQLTLGQTSASQLNIADAFLAPITSDRPDGLFPTIVSSETGHSLGLVYSSDVSVKESIITGNGVYHSRKHGLWRKGETSGATQDVVCIRLDCDSDSLEYRVIQHGAGFCHLNRQSCFSAASGLPALESTLQARLESAPEGSYTKRLFDDPQLLQSKIMEEAHELCQAKTPEDVAFEAADLLYFTLTKCITSGVGISDLEHVLDKKAKKVTRRPGNAKPQWAAKTSEAGVSAQPLAVEERPVQPTIEGSIRMRIADLSQILTEERADLLRRPVLKSEEMINKVKPIVDAVRQRGDEALLELTAKFDKVQLSSTVVFPPFAPETMQIDEEVRKAIDVAYANIRKFHEAQKNDVPLIVETMPGVVCSRFARPIARVGLYVPGGTAILPSTALMLGIPAQVAGCKEIVLATPPRPDGSISPEVVYVAHRVGASAILKAGGAQAVAAMAYGTKTVPKVDKIFGPGNQWVTAAKMLVQNDTDALVSIDMPAGPSEVLVSETWQRTLFKFTLTALFIRSLPTILLILLSSQLTCSPRQNMESIHRWYWSQ